MAPLSPTSKRPTEKTNGQNGEAPAKRVKLASDAYGSISTRQTGDLETSLEVDHMILDFLTYQAIEICCTHKNLPAKTAETSPTHCALLQVDEFFHLFKSRYPRYRPDVELRFRQALLQLVTLVTQRLSRTFFTPSTAALETLRSKNQLRARDWIGDLSRLPTAEYDTIAFDSELPIPADELELNRAHVLEKLGAAPEIAAPEHAFYGSKGCVSLLDLLPLFMRVSAICHRMFDSGLTKQWMQLAADWMLQGCLEQYLVFGSTGSDSMDEAFSWGYEKREGGEMYAGGEDKEDTSDDPFDSAYDEEKAENWEQIRDQSLATLIPEDKKEGERGKGLVSHLLEVSFDHPIADIESSIMMFLQGLAKCIPEPVLAQLEKGQLDGMSKEETQKFMKEDCGLDMSSLFLG